MSMYRAGYFTYDRHIFKDGQWVLWATVIGFGVALDALRQQSLPWKLVRTHRTWGDTAMPDLIIAQSKDAPPGLWEPEPEPEPGTFSFDFSDDQRRGRAAMRPARGTDFLPDEENRGYEP